MHHTLQIPFPHPHVQIASCLVKLVGPLGRQYPKRSVGEAHVVRLGGWEQTSYSLQRRPGSQSADDLHGGPCAGSTAPRRTNMQATNPSCSDTSAALRIDFASPALASRKRRYTPEAFRYRSSSTRGGPRRAAKGPQAPLPIPRFDPDRARPAETKCGPRHAALPSPQPLDSTVDPA